MGCVGGGVDLGNAILRRINQADTAREGRNTEMEFDSCQEECFRGDSCSTVGCDVSDATSVDVYCSEEEVAKIQEFAEERAEAALALASRKFHAACSALPASLAPGSAAQARAAEPLSSTGLTVSKGPTVMIRNIACRYCIDEVAVILDEAGLEGTYTFINIPMSMRGPKSSNLGYAFVGFKSQESADICWRLFSGQAFGRSSTNKRCEVAPAYDQDWMSGPTFGTTVSRNGQLRFFEPPPY